MCGWGGAWTRHENEFPFPLTYLISHHHLSFSSSISFIDTTHSVHTPTMPTPTEVTMAKMLVANLAPDRRKGLIDLLCEDDPNEVVHLLQIQQDRLQVAVFLDAINDVEYITEQSIRRDTLTRSIDTVTGQAAKRVRFSKSSLCSGISW